MIPNFWKNKNVAFYCMNGHEVPVPMKIMEGTTSFYACPRYMLMDKDHPDGHAPGEKSCANRMSPADAAEIVKKFSGMIEADLMDDIYTDYTGARFTYRGIDVTVLYYTDGKPRKDEDGNEIPSVQLGINNRTVTKNYG